MDTLFFSLVARPAIKTEYHAFYIEISNIAQTSLRINSAHASSAVA